MSKRVAIVGAGFGGIGAAVKLTQAGHDVAVFEKADRVGGVWHHNTYPGAACDIPSHLYEFSFAPNPDWSRRYAPQAEIQAYVAQVARRFAVADKVRLGVEVMSAEWDAVTAEWHLKTSTGSYTADILVTACGQLSTPSVPPLVGLDSFSGPTFHTARWRDDVDLVGKRVGVIGTGCSAVQVVPAIQPEVAALTVFQRSPGWTIPKGDRPYSSRERALYRRLPGLQRLSRQRIFYEQEFATVAMTRSPRLRRIVERIGRRQINRAISDPELRAKVTPTDEVGCKRIMLTDEWYPTLAKPNVSVVSQRITEVTPTGVLTADGVEHSLDVLVLATGFDSHGFVAPMEITGTKESLAVAWSETPRAYLGSSVPGFPNMFLLYGPNTNGGTGSVLNTLEVAISHVVSALAELEREAATTIEVRPDAADEFAAELRAKLPKTVWHSGCENWYVDENGNDPNQWPWLWTTFRRRVARIDPTAYSIA